MTPTTTNGDERRAGTLILDLARSRAARCARCGVSVCGHALLCGTVLGFKASPRCLPCLAEPFGRSADELRADVVAHIRRRDCFNAAWRWTSAREGPCAVARPLDVPAPGEGPPDAELQPSGDRIVPDEEWDAADMTCGDLVLELRRRLSNMQPDAVLMVTAHDPSAPEDLPAWSRITGHPLVYIAPPIYCVRRKGT